MFYNLCEGIKHAVNKVSFIKFVLYRLPGLGPSVGIKMKSFWENAYGSQRLHRWTAEKSWAPKHPNKLTTNFCEVWFHLLVQTSHLVCPQLQMQSFETKFGQLSVTSLGAQLEGTGMLHW